MTSETLDSQPQTVLRRLRTDLQRFPQGMDQRISSVASLRRTCTERSCSILRTVMMQGLRSDILFRSSGNQETLSREMRCLSVFLWL